MFPIFLRRVTGMHADSIEKSTLFQGNMVVIFVAKSSACIIVAMYKSRSLEYVLCKL